MINEVFLKRSIVVVLSTAIYTGTGIAYAFDMCKNMFGKIPLCQDSCRVHFLGNGNSGGGERVSDAAIQ
jgi:hypothetical protein